MEINVGWSDIKSFIENRVAPLQYVVANNTYYLFAADGPMQMTAQILMDGSQGSDQADFETNFKSNANKSPSSSVTVQNNPIVTTQYELNNKDLKLARAVGELPNDGSTTSVTLSMKIPGAWGTGPGRYIEGGYGISEDYNKDDYVLIWVSDDDRNIAMTVALAMNPSATTPVADAVIQSMGVVPGIGIAMPNYPIVKTYYDDDVQAESLANQFYGWYFWPLAQGNNLPPVGETEVKSIAGYALGPSGLYLKVQYCRPAGIFTGGLRINFSWARLGV